MTTPEESARQLVKDVATEVDECGINLFAIKTGVVLWDGDVEIAGRLYHVEVKKGELA